MIARQIRNYARNRLTGEYLFFWGADFSPRAPELWASWLPVRAERVYRIGESPEAYGLRQVVARGTSSQQAKARTLQRQIERFGPQDRLLASARMLASELRFSSRRAAS